MKILLNELNSIQDKNGFITEKDIAELSDRFGVRKAELFGIMSFYSRLYLKPQGKYIIRVCKSLSCNMNKGSKILKTITDHLKIKPMETTKDRLFSLEVVECLGSCDVSPAISINDKIYGNLSIDKIVDILDSLK